MPFDIYALPTTVQVHLSANNVNTSCLPVFDRSTGKYEIIKGLSSVELWIQIYLLLNKATYNNKRVLFGFDHSYSFPTGFYQTLTGQQLTNWRELLNFLNSENKTTPPLGVPVPFTHYRQLMRNYKWHTLPIEALEWITERFKYTTLPREWAAAVNNAFLDYFNPEHVDSENSLRGLFWGPISTYN